MSAAPAIIEHEHNALAVAESAAIIQVIERAAQNPNVDIDKMERLLMMQERIMARNAKAAYNAALARMQPELPAIEKKGKSNNGAYGLWEDIQGGIQPILAKHGFALSFKTSVSNDTITVTAILSHEDGHDDSTDLPLPTDKSGSKNSVQAVGSSVSYGKRYTASALLNIRVVGEDDDGATTSENNCINEEQIKVIRTLIEQTGADIAKFCGFLKVEAIPDIPSKQFLRAKQALEAKRRKG